MPRTPQNDSNLEPVINDTQATPPGSESAGDRYIIAGLGGAWSGYTIGNIVSVIDTGPTVWERYIPEEGDEVYVKAISKYKKWNGSLWAAAGSGVSSLEDLTDVSSASPTNKYVLVANGASFAARRLKASDPGNHKFDAIVDPTSSDDSSQGYEVGSRWINTVNDSGFTCVDASVGAAIWAPQTGMSSATHETLDQLVHNIAENSYEEILRTGPLVTSVIVWETDAKLKKIREVIITRSGNQIQTIVTKQYDGAGVLLKTMTETLTYSGGSVSEIDRVMS